jgi:hypothetical protein
MDINQKIFIIIIVILTLYLIYIQFYSDIERFTNTQTANEALQTMASIFTNQNATLGNLTTTGNITATGNITSNGTINSYADIDPNGKGSIFGHSNKTQAIGIGYNTIYTAGSTVDQPLNIQTKGKGDIGLISGGAVNITGPIVMKDTYQNLDKMRRLHDPAGYFRIRAYQYKTPIYYGWNMMWACHGSGLKYESTTGDISKITYNNIDMRNAGDGNTDWSPRHLVVYPGYIATLYYFGYDSTSGDIFQTGIYNFKNGFPASANIQAIRRVHGIYVSFVEEGAPSDLSQINHHANLNGCSC